MRYNWCTKRLPDLPRLDSSWYLASRCPSYIAHPIQSGGSTLVLSARPSRLKNIKWQSSAPTTFSVQSTPSVPDIPQAQRRHQHESKSIFRQSERRFDGLLSRHRDPQSDFRKLKMWSKTSTATPCTVLGVLRGRPGSWTPCTFWHDKGIISLFSFLFDTTRGSCPSYPFLFLFP